MPRHPGVEDSWLDDLSPGQLASAVAHTKANARGHGGGGGGGGGASSRVRQTALRWVDSSAVPVVHSSSERPLPIRKDAGVCSPSMESLEHTLPSTAFIGLLALPGAGASAAASSRERHESAHCTLPPSSHSQQQQQQAVSGPSAASRLRRHSPQRHAVKKEQLSFITPPPSRRNSNESNTTGTASLSVSVSEGVSAGATAWVPPSPLRIPTLPMTSPPPVHGLRRPMEPNAPAASLSNTSPSNSSGGEQRRCPSSTACNSTDASTTGDSTRTTTTATDTATTAAGTTVEKPRLPSLGTKVLSPDDSDVELDQELHIARAPPRPPFRPLHNASTSPAQPPSASAAQPASDSGNGVTSGTRSLATLTSQPPPSFPFASVPAPLSPAQSAASVKSLGVSPPQRTSGNTKHRPGAPSTSPPRPSLQPTPPPPNATSATTANALKTRQLATARKRRGSGGGTSTEDGGSAGLGNIAPATPSSISAQTASILSSPTSSLSSRYGAGGEWQPLPARRTNTTSSPASRATTHLSPTSSSGGGLVVTSSNSLALMPHLPPSTSAESPVRRGSLGSVGAVHAGLSADLVPRLSPSNTALPGAGAMTVHDLEPVTPLLSPDVGPLSGALRPLPKHRGSPPLSNFYRGSVVAAASAATTATATAAGAPATAAPSAVVTPGFGVNGSFAGLPLSGISAGPPAALLSAVASARLASQGTTCSPSSLQTPVVPSTGGLRLTCTSPHPLEANVCAVFGGSAYADARSSADLHILRALPAVRTSVKVFALPDALSVPYTLSPPPPLSATPRRPPAQPLLERCGACGSAASVLATPTTTEGPPLFPPPAASSASMTLTSPKAPAVPPLAAPAASAFPQLVGESGDMWPLPPAAFDLSRLIGASARGGAEHEHKQQEPWSPTQVALAALLTSLSSAEITGDNLPAGVHHAARYPTGSVSPPNGLHLSASLTRLDDVSAERLPLCTFAPKADSHSSLRDTRTVASSHSRICGCRIPGDSSEADLGNVAAVNAVQLPPVSSSSSDGGGGGGGGVAAVAALAPLDSNNSPIPQRTSADPHVTAPLTSSLIISVSAASATSVTSAIRHETPSLEHSITSTGPRMAAGSHASAAPLTNASQATSSPRPLATQSPPLPLPLASPPPAAPGAASAFKFRSVLASSERLGRGARVASRDVSSSSEYGNAVDSPESDSALRRGRGGKGQNSHDDFTTPLQYHVGSTPAGGIRIGRESVTAKQKRRSHDRPLPHWQHPHRGSRASRRDDMGASSPTAFGGRYEPWVGLQLPRTAITPCLSFTNSAPDQGLHTLARRSGHEGVPGALRRTNSDVCFGTFVSSVYSFRSSMEERVSSFYNTAGGIASPPSLPQSIDAELPAGGAGHGPSSFMRDKGNGNGSPPRSRSRVWHSSHREAGSRPQSSGGRNSRRAQAEFFFLASPSSARRARADDATSTSRSSSRSRSSNSSHRTLSSCTSILSSAMDCAHLVSSPVEPAAFVVKRTSEVATAKLRDSMPQRAPLSAGPHARSQLLLPQQVRTPTHARSWRSAQTGSTATTTSHPSVDEMSLLEDGATRRRSQHQRTSAVSSRSRCDSHPSSDRVHVSVQRQMFRQGSALQHPRKEAAAAAQDQQVHRQLSPQRHSRSAARASGKHRTVVVLSVAEDAAADVSSVDTGSLERHTSQRHPSQSQSPQHTPPPQPQLQLQSQSRRTTNFSSSANSPYTRPARSFSR